MRNVYKILGGEPERKRPVERRRHWWADNIKLYLEEIVRERIECIHVGQGKVQWRTHVNTVMNFGFHKRRAIPW